MKSSKHKVASRILETGAIAVVRVTDTDVLLHVIDALLEGGLDTIEITMTVPGAIEQIRALSKQLGDDALVGVGSVTTVEVANAAIDAGAKYVVSPMLKEDVVAATLSQDVVSIPGTFTPSEAQRAHDLGADLIKVFPADVLGMNYFKSVLAPLPHLNLMPTGGVTPANAGDWIRAGAKGVGVGSALLNKQLIANGDFAKITNLAKVLIDNVAEARAS